jgi:hypothetical protein
MDTPDLSLTALPPAASDEPTPERPVTANWWEDPRLGLNRLTPGQRYTLVLVVVLTALILRFGLPFAPTGLRGAVDSVRSAPSAPATTAAPDQEPQVSTSPSGFGTSPSLPSPLPSDSPGILDPLPDESATVPAASGSVTPPSTGTTPPAASSSPTPSPSTCPVSPPTTGTPVDSLSAELNALCEELLAEGSDTVPTGSLPGGASSITSGGGESAAPGTDSPSVREQWAFVDSPIGPSGVTDPKWPSPLSVEMSGKDQIVTVGLVQSSPVSNSLVSTLGTLVQGGALVQALLVPEPGATGGPQGFGSWVTQVLTTLKPVELVEIGTGSAPMDSNASTVAAYTAAGLAAARGASDKIAAGVLWLDGGTSSDDAAVWSSLDAVAAWSNTSFLARSLDATAACSSQSAFSTMERDEPVAAALPLVSEAVPDSASAGDAAAESSCMTSIAQNPAGSLALWRQWQGPAQ